MRIAEYDHFPDTGTRASLDLGSQLFPEPEHAFLSTLRAEPELTVFGVVGLLSLAAGVLIVVSFFS
jgi:hypothetical protein